MVGSTIPTSTWSHNCGMHVIADFLVEKLQQDNYQTVFTGKAYDELLKSFQKVYGQENLTWENIKESSVKRNKTDLQIIWGYALRIMLPAVVEKNTEYKQDLFNSFLAAMNLFEENKFEELQTTYPILYFACQDYFKEQALNVEANSAEDLHYWNENGFENYCEALITMIEESHSFLWLSKEELSIFCQYFNFEFEFVDHVDRVEWDSSKLYFSNETQTHWERKTVDENATEPSNQMASSAPSAFYEYFFKKNSEAFFEHPKAVGEIFFSELYSEPTLGLDLYKNIQDEKFRKDLSQKDIKILINCAKENIKNKKQLEEIFAWGIVYFDYQEIIDLLKSPEGNSIFPVFYSTLLLGAVKYKKQEIFNQLLTDFPKEYHASACMPALILAAQQDSPEFAYQLLSRPDFDTNGFMSQAISYVKPAFVHVLNQFDENKVPALYYAIQNNNLSLASSLLEKGACATYKVRDRIAFEWALDTANLDMIDLFIKTVSPLELLSLYNHEGNNCFHLCFKIKALGWHLNKWTKIYLNDDLRNIIKEVLNAPNRQGLNILHISAVDGYLEGIEYCLEHQVSLFSQDLSGGNTALHFASAYGQLEVVKLLVSAIQKSNDQASFDRNKFDFNQKNKNKMSPLHLANDNQHIEVAKYLKTIGCTDWVHDAYTELYLLCQQDKPDFDKFCLNNKDKLNTQGSGDFTLLHYVSYLIQVSPHTQTIIKKLIEHGAKHNAVSHQGDSPLHLAALHNNVDAIEALLAQGAFINAINNQGMTACHFAADKDALDAFLLLKNKGANLDLPAFATAGIDEEPLTAVYLAGHRDEKIAAHLKQLNLLKKENISDTPKVKFHSFEHRGIHWAENLFGMKNHYVSNLCSELRSLENTFTYQFLSMLKVGLSVAGASMIGPYAGSCELAKQSILHASPTLKQKAGQFYYYIKPGIHNYNLPYASSGLDIAATGISLVYEGLFKTLNYLDLGNNFGRRVIGGGIGIGALKAAQKLGAERQAQATTLFLARELGYLMVDAYHASSPERKAHQVLMQYHVNPTLNQAYEIWGSIVGKNLAEMLIQNAQFAVEFKANFYQSVGESERAVFDCIEAYVDLRNHLSNSIDFVFNNPVSKLMLAPPQMLKLEAEQLLNAISEKTNSVLLGLEEFIHTHLVPESEYQCMMLKYAYTQKRLLTQNLKHQAEIQLKQAIESDNQQNIAYYEEIIKNYAQDIVASEQLANQYYEQTAKGKIANQYYAAQQQNFEAWSDARDFDNLKNLDPELYFDQAYASLGETISPEKFYQYLVSVFQMKNITVDDKAWESFKLTLDASKMKDTDFKQNLKSQWSTFAHTEIQNHITEATPDSPTSLDNSELEQLINDFKPLATPEELRALELNQKIEVKIDKYNIFKEQRESQIHQSAITYAKYATYLISAKEYDDAQLDYILGQENLNNIQIDINKKIKELNEKKNVTEAERNEWLEEYNEYIDKAKSALIIKEETFIQKKNALQKIELDFSGKLTPLEKYQFKNFSKDFKENIDLVSRINHAEIKNDLDKKYRQYEVDNEEELQAEINLKNKDIAQINAFKFDVNEMRELVGNALAESDTADEYKVNIDKRLAKILPFPEYFFRLKVNVSIGKHDRLRGAGVSATKDNHATYICNQLKKLDYEYISFKKELLEEEVIDLNKKLPELNSRIEFLDKKITENQAHIDSLASEYVQKLPPEQQMAFQNRNLGGNFSNNAQNSTPQSKPNTLEKTIDTLIDEGFKKYPNRDELSGFLADSAIELKIQREGVTKTKKQMTIYRQLLKDEIFKYHLSGYQRKTERAKKRSYNCMYAEITGTEKKRHRHRHEKILKPFINEIMSELTGGYRPYKDFKGGEDKKGQSGLQLTWQTDGRITLGIQKNNVPVWTLYDSEEPKRTIPEFSQPSQKPLAISNTELKKPATIPVAPPAQQVALAHVPSLANSVFQGGVFHETPQNFPGPLRPEHLPEEIKNPQPKQVFVPLGYQDAKQPTIPLSSEKQSIPELPKIVSPTQHKSQKPAQTAAQPKPPQSSSTAAKPDLLKPQPESKPATIPLEAKKPEPVIFSTANKPEDGWWKMVNRSYKGENSPEIAAWLKKNTQATPKWLVQISLDMKEVSHPVEQIPRLVIESLGESAKILLKDNFSLDNFFQGQSVEGLMAEEKLRQQSYFMMGKFFGEEATRIMAKEKPESFKYAEKFISNFYHSSQDEKFKGLVKIGIAAAAYRFLGVRNPRLVSSAFGYMAKSQNNTMPLALQGSPKTFLPNYRYQPTLTTLMRHGQKINVTSLGRYNPHENLKNQGPIPDARIKTFMGSTFKSYRLQQDIVLNRVGDSITPLGQYFSFSRANGAYSDRMDRAILPKWIDAKEPNVVDTSYYVHIPKGTIIHVGKAASQGGVFLGGTEQVFITKPWDIPGVSIVYRHPIKEAHLWNTKVTK